MIVDPSPSFLSDPFTAAMVSGLSNVVRAADMLERFRGKAFPQKEIVFAVSLAAGQSA